MKKSAITSLIVASSALLLSVPGLAKDGVYAAAGIGVAATQHDDDFKTRASGQTVNGVLDFDTGVHVNGALGYKMDPVRIEAAIGYINNDLDQYTLSGTTVHKDGELRTTTYMLNGYYDFKNDSAFTPYVGLGLGAARMDLEGSDAETAFAYQGILGVSYAMTDQLSITSDYRYLSTNKKDVRVNATTDVELQPRAHLFNVGLQYVF